MFIYMYIYVYICICMYMYICIYMYMTSRAKENGSTCIGCKAGRKEGRQKRREIKGWKEGRHIWKEEGRKEEGNEGSK